MSSASLRCHREYKAPKQPKPKQPKPKKEKQEDSLLRIHLQAHRQERQEVDASLLAAMMMLAMKMPSSAPTMKLASNMPTMKATLHG